MSLTASAPHPPTPARWLVSPGFDLVFVANLLWPLVLVPFLADGPTAPLSIWQLYFVTTPHRWITLLLVATDPDRRTGRSRLFLSLAVVVGGVVATIYFCTGDFTCLIVVDLVWNAWHFGSQHAGVLRVYSRLVGGGWELLERHGTRLFVTYVGLRVPTAFVVELGSRPELEAATRIVDLVMLVIPAVLLGTTIAGVSARRIGKLAYVASFTVLYTGLLLAVRSGDSRLTVALALASALFHATEYLAIVTHYAWRRRSVGSAGLFRRMANNWLLVLVSFASGMGLLAAASGTIWADLWVGLNLVAALLHYAYDGLIWKLRRPETAQALGVGGST